MPTLPATIPIAATEGLATFKKLVVAYDFSPYADTALDYALHLATRHKSEVILVHVHSSADHAVAGEEDFEAAHKLSRDLSERLEQLADRSRGLGVETRWLLRAGLPADVLTQTVADLKPDILCLGAYGNDRLDRKVLGSTTEFVLRTLPCPVVTIGPKAVKKSSDPNGAERVICPIDFPEDVDDRLRIIARLAKALRAEVELVHAVDVRHEYSRPHNAADTQFEFDLLVGRLLRDGVTAQSALLYGTPERVISERANAVNAQYIMFGLHKDRHFSSYFRKSLVAGVIKNAPCAILTFAQPVEANLRNVTLPARSSSWQHKQRNV
ncbi:universal stress protein [Edaphobacter bradus]|uniref:universal stress protein n=1 Tax=Edaphobacter bradus TaxID=2259016 RepID=UPI0021E0314A|nr:universal stress protein [Edaphobacter bradus]